MADSPHWTLELYCGPKASPTKYLPNEHIYGPLLEIHFNKKIACISSYFDLLKVGPEGRLATLLTVRLNFTNNLDLDDDGNV